MAVIDGNKVLFEGDLGHEPRGALVCLHQLANLQREPNIKLDFNAVSRADAQYMLPLVSYVTYYRLNGVDFELTLPSRQGTMKKFVNSNWAHLMCPSKYEQKTGRIGSNLPALQYIDGDSQFNVVNKVMDILLETIAVADRKQLKALEWALNEVTDNVLNHAESAIGGIIQLECDTKGKRVSFYVVDAGLGIPKTLREAISSITSDSDALDRAIREGVTRNSATNQGNGLFGTFKCCSVSGGLFYIRSNNAQLSFANDSLTVKTDKVPFRGSFISATINYDTPRLLEKALVFRGRIHEPGNDYIDMHYEQQDEMLIFELAKESEGFGSREFGRRTKTKIDNILVDQKSRIIFDFTEVPIVSSSYADEAFGKLFVELGPTGFARRCSFKSMDSTVQRLIDRSIMLRMKAS